MRRPLGEREQAMYRLHTVEGWTLESAGSASRMPSFELTMPAKELRPIIERVYWTAVNSLADNPHELDEDVVAHCQDATTACPEILARLADDDLDPAAQHSAVATAAQ